MSGWNNCEWAGAYVVSLVEEVTINYNEMISIMRCVNRY